MSLGHPYLLLQYHRERRDHALERGEWQEAREWDALCASKEKLIYISGGRTPEEVIFLVRGILYAAVMRSRSVADRIFRDTPAFPKSAGKMFAELRKCGIEFTKVNTKYRKNPIQLDLF